MCLCVSVCAFGWGKVNVVHDLYSHFKGLEARLDDGLEAEGASRWVSRESEVKWQLDVADLSRSRVGERAKESEREREREEKLYRLCL